MAEWSLDDDGPRRPTHHVIGETLDELSVGDLSARIALLRGEIERLEAARAAKEAARTAAGAIFKTS